MHHISIKCRLHTEHCVRQSDDGVNMALVLYVLRGDQLRKGTPTRASLQSPGQKCSLALALEGVIKTGIGWGVGGQSEQSKQWTLRAEIHSDV
jgi:hypothetical protein